MPKNTSPHPRLLQIRKYSNRRYYDSTRSQHITLEEIRRLIREGYDIRVVDSKSSADLTGQVLAQIILDLDTEKLNLLPAEFLTRIIRFNYDLVENYVGKYLNQSMLAFMDWQHQMGSPFGASPGWPHFAGAAPAWPGPPWAGPAGPVPGRGEGAAEPEPESAWAEQLEALQKEVERLRQRVGGTRKPSPAGSKAKAKKK